MQMTILAITLVLMAVVAIVFSWVIGQSTQESGAKSAEGAETYRTKLLVGMAVAGLILTVASLEPWPHALAADAQSVHVDATGAQWSWELVPNKVPAGKPIVFSVNTTDVNHGFSVYDPSGRLLFQAQAMPGYTNHVSYTFDKPGKYEINCLEYCGLGHHNMTDVLTVE